MAILGFGGKGGCRSSLEYTIRRKGIKLVASKASVWERRGAIFAFQTWRDCPRDESHSATQELM